MTRTLQVTPELLRGQGQQSSDRAVIHRVAGADDAVELAVLANCATGALTTVALDELFQVGKWLLKGKAFRQNWCDTLFSALFGCVFGVAGGAFERMIIGEGASLTQTGVVNWLIRKLRVAGYNFLAGKLGSMIAKAGCADSEEKTASLDEASGEAGSSTGEQSAEQPETVESKTV